MFGKHMLLGMQRRWDTARILTTNFAWFLSSIYLDSVCSSAGVPTSGPQMGTSPWPVRNWDEGHTAGGEQKAENEGSSAAPRRSHDYLNHTPHPPHHGSVEKLFMKPEFPDGKMVGDHSCVVLYGDSFLPEKVLYPILSAVGERSKFLLEPFGFSCKIIHAKGRFEEANFAHLP